MFLQEQQDARLERVQGRGYLPHGDRGRDGVVVEGEDEQGAGRAVGEGYSAVSQRVTPPANGRTYFSIRKCSPAFLPALWMRGDLV